MRVSDTSPYLEQKPCNGIVLGSPLATTSQKTTIKNTTTTSLTTSTTPESSSTGVDNTFRATSSTAAQTTTPLSTTTSPSPSPTQATALRTTSSLFSTSTSPETSSQTEKTTATLTSTIAAQATTPPTATALTSAIPSQVTPLERAATRLSPSTRQESSSTTETTMAVTSTMATQTTSPESTASPSTTVNENPALQTSSTILSTSSRQGTSSPAQEKNTTETSSTHSETTSPPEVTHSAKPTPRQTTASKKTSPLFSTASRAETSSPALETTTSVTSLLGAPTTSPQLSTTSTAATPTQSTAVETTTTPLSTSTRTETSSTAEESTTAVTSSLGAPTTSPPLSTASAAATPTQSTALEKTNAPLSTSTRTETSTLPEETPTTAVSSTAAQATTPLSTTTPSSAAPTQATAPQTTLTLFSTPSSPETSSTAEDTTSTATSRTAAQTTTPLTTRTSSSAAPTQPTAPQTTLTLFSTPSSPETSSATEETTTAVTSSTAAQTTSPPLTTPSLSATPSKTTSPQITTTPLPTSPKRDTSSAAEESTTATTLGAPTTRPPLSTASTAATPTQSTAVETTTTPLSTSTRTESRNVQHSRGHHQYSNLKNSSPYYDSSYHQNFILCCSNTSNCSSDSLVSLLHLLQSRNLQRNRGNHYCTSTPAIPTESTALETTNAPPSTSTRTETSTLPEETPTTAVSSTAAQATTPLSTTMPSSAAPTQETAPQTTLTLFSTPSSPETSSTTEETTTAVTSSTAAQTTSPPLTTPSLSATPSKTTSPQITTTPLSTSPRRDTSSAAEESTTAPTTSPPLSTASAAATPTQSTALETTNAPPSTSTRTETSTLPEETPTTAVSSTAAQATTPLSTTMASSAAPTQATALQTTLTLFSTPSSPETSSTTEETTTAVTSSTAAQTTSPPLTTPSLSATPSKTTSPQITTTPLSTSPRRDTSSAAEESTTTAATPTQSTALETTNAPLSTSTRTEISTLTEETLTTAVSSTAAQATTPLSTTTPSSAAPTQATAPQTTLTLFSTSSSPETSSATEETTTAVTSSTAAQTISPPLTTPSLSATPSKTTSPQITTTPLSTSPRRDTSSAAEESTTATTLGAPTTSPPLSTASTAATPTQSTALETTTTALSTSTRTETSSTPPLSTASTAATPTQSTALETTTTPLSTSFSSETSKPTEETTTTATSSTAAQTTTPLSTTTSPSASPTQSTALQTASSLFSTSTSPETYSQTEKTTATPVSPMAAKTTSPRLTTASFSSSPRKTSQEITTTPLFTSPRENISVAALTTTAGTSSMSTQSTFPLPTTASPSSVPTKETSPETTTSPLSTSTRRASSSTAVVTTTFSPYTISSLSLSPTQKRGHQTTSILSPYTREESSTPAEKTSTVVTSSRISVSTAALFSSTATTHPTTAAALEPFTINFTTTNLRYSSDLANPDSAKYRNTRMVMNTLLDRLLKESSIGPSFHGCQTTAFRQESSGRPPPSHAPTHADFGKAEPALLPRDGCPGSTKASPVSQRAQRRVLRHRAVFSRPVQRGEQTGVDAVCTYRKEPSDPPLDRVGLYHEVSNKTKGITQLGPYSLDKDSLYVNGYNEQPVLPREYLSGPGWAQEAATASSWVKGAGGQGSDRQGQAGSLPALPSETWAGWRALCLSMRSTDSPPLAPLHSTPLLLAATTHPTTAAALEPFTINFTTTNLRYSSDLANPDSAKYRNTRMVMNTLLDRLLKESSIGPSFHGCQTTAFRTFSLPQALLPPVVLPKSLPSLPALSPPGTESVAPGLLSLNSFLSPVLPHLAQGVPEDFGKAEPALLPRDGCPGSTKASPVSQRAQRRVLRHRAVFSRPVQRGEQTGVDAVCTYRKEPSDPPLDRVGLYHEVSNKTKGITQLGPYSLDKDSLYVNGYNEQPVLPREYLSGPGWAQEAATASSWVKGAGGQGSDRQGQAGSLPALPSETWAGWRALCLSMRSTDSPPLAPLHSTPLLLAATTHPTTAAALEPFTINFTTTNLRYSSDLANPDSAKYRNTRMVMNTLLDRLLKESSIGPSFHGCQTTAFRQESSGRPPPSHAPTHADFGKAEPALLPRDGCPGSTKASPVSQRAQRRVLRHRAVFSRPVQRGEQTGVDAVCTYRKEPSDPPLDRVGLYHEVSNKTKGITQLGPYSLDKDSLYVNGYNEQPVLPPTTHPTTAAALEPFTINFTTTNLRYSSDLANPDSAKYRNTRMVMNTLLDRLLKESSIGPSFHGCQTTAFRQESSGRPPPSHAPTHADFGKAEPALLPRDGCPGSTKASPVSQRAQRRVLRHRAVFSRPVQRGEQTGVDAVCTYRKEPSDPPLDRVGLYHEVSNKTKGITQLGPYSLDKDSLYVNGYNEQPVLPPTTHPTTAAALEPFTINFTTTNLRYSSDLANPDSAKYRNTRMVMNTLLDRLLKESSIGPSFHGCQTTAFRQESSGRPPPSHAPTHADFGKAEPALLPRDGCPGSTKASPVSQRAQRRVLRHRAVFSRPVQRGEQTGVDAVCTYRKEPSDPPLDRVGLYHEVSNKTKGITQLGPYSLDKDSLYVNGYNEQPVLPPTTHPTTAAALEPFTINFTTTNLRYSSDLANPDSAKYRNTRMVMNTLLDRLLKESSIGPSFHGCQTTAFRQESSGRPPPSHAPTHADFGKAEPALLPRDGCPGSTKASPVSQRAQRRVLRHRAVFSRPVQRGEQTGVDAVCTYRKEPSDPPLDRVGLYHEVSNKTKGITQLGPYSLDKDSLYVNGYNEQPVLPPTTHPTTAAALEPFTINFTTTNLRYSSDLANPDSAKYRNTRMVMNTLLDRLLKESSIGPSFHGCQTTAFRQESSGRPPPSHAPTHADFGKAEPALLPRDGCPGSTKASPVSQRAQRRVLRHRAVFSRPVQRGEQTGVDAVCTYRKEPSDPPLDRVGLYHEVSNKTKGITQLGPYSLDKDSLYVNGYNEQPVLPREYLSGPGWAQEAATASSWVKGAGSQGSDRQGQAGSLPALPSETWAGWRALCLSMRSTDSPPLAPLHSTPLLLAATTHPTTAAALEPFTINFTTTNLRYSSDLANPDSAKYRNTRMVMNTLLDRLLKESSIGPSFHGCQTTAFRQESSGRPPPSHAPTHADFGKAEPALLPRDGCPGSTKASPVSQRAQRRVLRHRAVFSRPVQRGEQTGVDAVCTYRKEPSDPPLDRVGLYHEVSNKTKGITQLGPYSLDKDSLYVNGYNEQPVLPPTTHPTTAAALEPFTINFTTTNLRYSSDLANPDSAKYRNTRMVMNTLLDRLLKESSIGPSFHGCQTTAFRQESSGRPPPSHAPTHADFGKAEPALLPRDGCPGSTKASPVSQRAQRRVLRHRAVFSRPVQRGEQTGVDAVCTYRKEPSDPPLDRVGLYHEVSNKTKGITQLGPYSLDKDSLYVNGYNEQPVLPREYLSGPGWAQEAATASSWVKGAGGQGSDRQGQAGSLPALPSETWAGWRALCLSMRSTDSPPLAPLHSTPLLLAATTHPTTAAALEPFTINFTTTNLRYSSDLANPDSAKYRNTRMVMNTLLDRLLKESSIGPSFHGCQTTAFRQESSGRPPPSHAPTHADFGKAEPALLPRDGCPGSTKASPVSQRAQRRVLRHRAVFSRPVQRGEQTGVDAVCTYRKEPSDPPLDRVGLYHEVSNKTKGITQLGPYSLDKDSLYVNGYNEQPVLPPTTHPTTAAALEPFTINFTTTNLRYSSDLANPDSAKYRNTRMVMNTLLDRLLKESSIGPSFHGCQTTAFRQESSGRPPPSHAPTHADFGKAEPALLPRDGCPGSTKASPVSQRAQRRVLRHRAVFSRPVQRGEQTGVDAVCTYRKEPSDPPLDRVGLYHEVSNKTKGITQLGPYSLDKDSLYVNGYNEQPVLPREYLSGPGWAQEAATASSWVKGAGGQGSDRQGQAGSLPALPSETWAGWRALCLSMRSTDSPPLAPLHSTPLLLAATTHPTTAAALEPFTINFTTTNLRYSSDLANPDSAKYRNTRMVMNTLLDRLLKESSIGPSFHGCQTTAFRQESSGRPPPSHAPTHADFGKAEPALLPRDGCPGSTKASPVSQRAQRRVLRHRAVFSRPVQRGEQTGVDAVCTYRKEPSDPPLDRVGLYHEVSNKTKGITQLGPYSLDKDSLYVNGYNEQPVLPPTTHPTTAAALEPFTINFTTTNLRYSSDLANPDSAKYRNTRMVMNTLLDRLLKESSIGPSFHGCQTTAFRQESSGRPPPSHAPTHAPTHADFGKAEPALLPRDGCPGSTKASPVSQRAQRRVLRHRAVFSRPVQRGEQTGVDAVCTYRKEPSDPPLDRVGLYHEVSNKTKGITQLGPYSLDKDSLYVNGYNEQPVLPREYLSGSGWAQEAATASSWVKGAGGQGSDRQGQAGSLPALPSETWAGWRALCLSMRSTDSPPLAPLHSTPLLLAATTHPTTAAALEPFTINFTTTNLRYSSDLANPDSAKYRNTRMVMNTLLDRLLKESSIGPSFHGCQTTAFRQESSGRPPPSHAPTHADFGKAEPALLPRDGCPGSTKASPVSQRAQRRVLRHRAVFSRPVQRGEQTGVDAVCTYRKEPSDPPLDRVGLYHEVSNKTKGITQLGPYSLDKDSLYVNGYNEQPVLPREYLSGSGWAQEAATASSWVKGAGGQGSDRQGQAGSLPALPSETWAGWRALCLSMRSTDSPPLAPLHSTPLLLAATTHPTTAAALEPFTINFTTTNLRYSSDLANPDSAKYRNTRMVMNTLLDRLLKESSIGPSFHGCQTTAFRQESSGRPPPSHAPTHAPTHADFGKAEPALLPRDGCPGSTKASPVSQRAQRRVLRHCAVFSRPVQRGEQTGVDAVCTYRKEPSDPPLDRVGLYHEVSNKTKGITQLGPYSLDKDSLYVNGYNEQPVLPREYLSGSAQEAGQAGSLPALPSETWAGWRALCLSMRSTDSPPLAPLHSTPLLLAATTHPTTAAALEPFTINFTTTNLRYSSDLANPDSAKYRNTRMVMNTLLDRLLKESSIGPSFHGCQTTAFRQESSGRPPPSHAPTHADFGKAEPALLPRDGCPGSTKASPVSQRVQRRVLRHRAVFSRPVQRGEQTGVDAVCTYRKEPSDPPLDRVGLYHEVSNKTKGITQLGPYSLDKDSLYVNGYNEQPVLPPTTHPTTAAALEPFTINFTTTNLRYSSDLANPDSAKYRNTRMVMNTLLDRLLKESSIGPSFHGCQTTAFRQESSGRPPPSHAPTHADFGKAEPALLPRDGCPGSTKASPVSQRAQRRVLRHRAVFSRPVQRGEQTGVDAVCTYRKEPSDPPLDRVGLYHEVSNKTKGITQLGPYSLDKDSLYVNGYNEQPVLPPTTHPTTAAALEPFTINFTTTNLRYSSDLANPDSAKYRNTRMVMNTLLDRLLKESSIGPSFHGCQTTAFRQESSGRPPPSHAPTHAPTHADFGKAEPALLPRDGCPGSTKASPVSQRAQRRVLRHRAVFSRPVQRGEQTGVDAVCTYRKEPSDPPLDRVGLYHEVSNKTKGITQLGPYSLDKDSLYVNGYNEQPVLPREYLSGPGWAQEADTASSWVKGAGGQGSDRQGQAGSLPALPSETWAGWRALCLSMRSTDSPPLAPLHSTPLLLAATTHPTTAAALEPFTINFTTTNLRYSSDLANPDSAKYRNTRMVMNTLLDRLLKESSIGPSFHGCQTTAFRQESSGRPPPSHAPTHADFGKAEPALLPRDGCPGSTKASPVSQRVQRRVLRHRAVFSRPVQRGEQTGVDAVCTYRKEPSDPPLDRVGLYHEVSNKTKGITQLGPYSLDKDSLYVNGYNEQPVLPPTTHPTTAAALEPFTINFTTTNLRYSSDLANPDSAKYRNTRMVMNTLLDRLLKESSIGPSFHGCQTTAFRQESSGRPPPSHAPTHADFGKAEPALLPRDGCPGSTKASPVSQRAQRRVLRHRAVFSRPVQRGEQTGVDAVCTYRKEPSDPPLDRVGLYHEVSNKTKGITQLGPYSLDKDSLYVNGYNEQPVLPPITHPTTAAALEPFTINFTTTNLRYSSDLANPDSAKYRNTRMVMNTLLDRLLKESSIGPSFHGCQTTAFRTFSLPQALLPPVVLPKSLPSLPALSPPGTESVAPGLLSLNSFLSPVLPHLAQGVPEDFGKAEPALLPRDGCPGSTKASPVSQRAQRRVLRHRAVFSRPVQRGEQTGVDAVCTYRKEPSDPPLDRVGLYHEVSNKTKGITQLGPYSLDKDSLYVNGYNEQPVLPREYLSGPGWAQEADTASSWVKGAGGQGSDRQGQAGSLPALPSETWAGWRALCLSMRSTDSPPLAPLHSTPLLLAATTHPTTAAALEPFTINFTTTNLRYSSDLANPDSAKYRNTRMVMNTLLDRLLKESSIGPSFHGCQTTAFRQESSGRPPPSHAPTHADFGKAEPALLPRDGCPGSTKASPVSQRVQRRVLRHRAVFSRPVQRGEQTGVDAVCTYRKEPSDPPLDRVGLYHEVSNKTKGITQLGPYSLDKDSLYVNGYNEQPVLPREGQIARDKQGSLPALPSETWAGWRALCLSMRSTDSPPLAPLHSTPLLLAATTHPTTAAALEPFTINFTTTNLRYSSDLANPDSAKYRNTRMVMNTLLDRLLKESSIGPSFHGCQTTAFRTFSLPQALLPPVVLPKSLPSLPARSPPGTESVAPGLLSLNSFLSPVLPHLAQGVPEDFGKAEPALLPRDGCPGSTKASPVSQRAQRRVLRHRAVFSRPVQRGEQTGVDAVCTYRKEPSNPPLDRVGLYHEVSNKTKGITQLGPYSLDKDSLYVNGYNEQPVLPPTTHPTTAAALEPFTINFTTTNLRYSSDLANPDSAKYRNTRMVMNTLLDRLLKESSIGPSFHGCQTTAFRQESSGRPPPSHAPTHADFGKAEPALLPRDGCPGSTKASPVSQRAQRRVLRHRAVFSRPVQRGEQTGVDAVCTYRKEPSDPPLDRVGLYHEVSNKTKGITQLGPYSLDKDSLYVNGYNEQPVLPPTTHPTTAAALEPFTINFTTTNLRYSSDLANPDSAKYRNTRMVMNTLLDRLLKESSIGPSFHGCQTTAFRQESSGRPPPSHAPTHADFGKAEPALLPRDGCPGSTKASPVSQRAQRRVLRHRAVFSRPVQRGEQTGVDAVCTYRKEPSDPPLDRVGLYHEVSNKTKGITQLGPYSLDKDSLYVNGYHEMQAELGYNEQQNLSMVKPTTTQSPELITEQFTLNFTVTNLRFTSDLGTPNSAKFKSTAKIMQHYIDPLLQKSDIGPHFTGCKVTGFRSVRNRDNTGVDYVCSYGDGSQIPNFDQAKVYQELRSMTNGITKLGIYNLDNKSLYVNGYNEPLERSPLSITTAPSPASSHFTLNFTLTNLRYTADLDTPTSRKFISTMKVLNHYIDPLFRKSSISSVYTGCKIMRFRSGRIRDDTGVDAVCSYNNNISLARFDRETVYHELSTMTNNVTKLGHYSLEKNSLYVNGFPLTDTAVGRKPVLIDAPAKLGYKLSFRIVNENLTNPDSQSPEYKAAVENIGNKINELYRQSHLRDQFLYCNITRLRTGSIVVDCNCFFHPETSINRTVVERAFQDNTSNATGLWLGNSFQLQEFSVNSLELSIEAATPNTPLKSEKEDFRLNFSISNLTYSPELQDSGSQMYQVNKEKIEKELEVFRTSSLKDNFVGCAVQSFGPVHGKAYTSVASICEFTLLPFSGTLQKEEVYKELKLLTHGFTKLGLSYELEEQSLVVEGYSPPKKEEQVSERSELQFWAIILICVFTLLGFILLLLLCFLIVFCLRRKSHLYQVQQGMYGVYFPHLNTRKVH
ncbi:mucin-16 [Heliangelus exortis]|uniref:mucin-16 n=1 Tax=Heliangelus exortis TaxID=472823 RepID=UPI003A8F67BF